MKIKFLDRWDDTDDPHCEKIIVGIDGTDYKINRQQHETFPMDLQLMPHKFKHAGLKYKIGVAIFEDKIVCINGPFKGGKHDLTIFREDSLKGRMLEGKTAVLDCGYKKANPTKLECWLPLNLATTQSCTYS